MKLLNKIQQELKAPKNLRNTFANYNYRSAESILEAVKPLLGEAIMTLTDEMIQVGERVYVKATATLKDGEESISTIAYAREAESKKGQDDSQITGSASSYARKYALNGLFLIDDNKDADTGVKHREEKTTVDLEKVKKELAGLTTHKGATDYYKKNVGKGFDNLLIARGKELTGK